MLSKETTDQIRKESKKWALSDCDTMSSIAYREGAEKWAIWKEKAEGYEKALKEIAGVELCKKYIIAIANKAIEQFK